MIHSRAVYGGLQVIEIKPTPMLTHRQSSDKQAASSRQPPEVDSNFKNEGIRSKKSSGQGRPSSEAGGRLLTASLGDGLRACPSSSGTNNREKWRQQNVNRAFVNLRRLLPTHPPDKRLSKNEILRMAIKYIKLLESILNYHSAPSAADHLHQH